MFQKSIAVAGIIVLSHYCPSHASYHRSIHSSPNAINENGNSNRYKHRIGDLHTNGEFTHLSQADAANEARKQSQSQSPSQSQQSNDSYQRHHTSKQYQQQQYHQSQRPKNGNKVGPSDHHRDNRSPHNKKDRPSQSSASTHKEDGLIGVPSVQICGMVVNQSNDDDPKDDVTPQPRRNGHLEASLLQIPCSLLLRTTTSGTTNPIPIATYLDTGAQVSVMTMKAAKRAGLAHLIDKRYAGRAIGVAGISCGVLGRISARTVSLVFGGCHNDDGSGCVVVDRSPAIFVLEEGIGDNGDGVDLLLGLDALEEWNAGICLRDRTLTIRSENISKSATDGGGANGEENLVVSFVNTGDTSGKNGHTTKLHTRKENTHQHHGSSNLNTHDVDPIQQKSVAKTRNISSPSTPWVVTSRRVPAIDLESDLDLLDNTNSGACQHGTDKVTPEVLRERKGSWETDNLYFDDDFDDCELSDTDFDYDSCDLSGI